MMKAVFSVIKLEGDAGAAVVWSDLETLETLLKKRQREQFQRQHNIKTHWI